MTAERVNAVFSVQDVLDLIEAADSRMGGDPVGVYTLLAVAAEMVLLSMEPDIARQVRKQAKGKIPPMARTILDEIENGNSGRPN